MYGDGYASMIAGREVVRRTVFNAGATNCDRRAHGANGALVSARSIDRQFLATRLYIISWLSQGWNDLCFTLYSAGEPQEMG